MDAFRGAGRTARGSSSNRCRTPSGSAWRKWTGERIVGIEEKPRHPKSHYAVTGIYMYDATVFDKIKTLIPSGRGELEITDVNNAYIIEGTMTFCVSRRLVDRCRNIRIAASRSQSGGREREDEGRAGDVVRHNGMTSVFASDSRSEHSNLRQRHWRCDPLAGVAQSDRRCKGGCLSAVA